MLPKLLTLCSLGVLTMGLASANLGLALCAVWMLGVVGALRPPVVVVKRPGVRITHKNALKELWPHGLN